MNPMTRASTLYKTILCASTLWLAGCEIPGMGPDPRVVQRETDGKAIGGACRHALKGIEDCYLANEKASKTAIFAGWKEMDVYMRENKIEGQRTATIKKAEPMEEIIESKPAKGAMTEKSPMEPKTTAKVAAK
jgi:hypothetical protein